MTEILKSCPFCGGKPYLDGDCTWGIASYYIYCDCGIKTKPFTGFNGKNKVIELWNRRVNNERGIS